MKLHLNLPSLTRRCTAAVGLCLARRAVSGSACCLLLLVWAAGSGVALGAQDTNGVVETKDLNQTDPSAVESQATESAEEQPASTNQVSETNQVFVPGPDGRTRRLSRPPPARPQLPALPPSRSRSAASGSNSAPAGLDYSAFQIIAERNIFDPNRAPRSSRPAAQPKTVDAFSLVGTMSYDKGIFAFFDGTSADYRKVLKPDGSIAGYKLVAISPDSVKLEMNTNVLELRIGTQMRRRDDGSWELSAQPSAYAAATPASTAAPAEAAPTGAESDVLKKMMLRREKE